MSPHALDATALAALEARARAVRRATVRMAHDGRTPHVGSALSCADLLVALYFHAMRVDPAGADEDLFVMSKGHGCMSYYATLAERGYFPASLLATYARNGSVLPEHPTPGAVRGVTVATGSLGHGLAIATGVALARVMAARTGRAFVLLSDGECNEGSVWEAAMFAAGRRLERLTAIVDYNKLQAMGPTEEITALAPLADKWRAFQWATVEVDGHDLEALARVLAEVPFEPGRPSAVIAHTVKGKGVSFMENQTEWHYRPPNDDELVRALAELAG
jgi:transketolase